MATRLKLAHDVYSLTSRCPGIRKFKLVFGRRALVSCQLPDLLGRARLRSKGSINQPLGLHDYANPELFSQLCELAGFAMIGFRFGLCEYFAHVAIIGPHSTFGNGTEVLSAQNS